MREIKFRGLTANSEEPKWLYGSLVTGLFHNINTKEDCAIIVDPTGNPDFDCLGDLDDLDLDVDIKTVGQYTGLKDKNGVEIYEGDIIAFQRFANYEYAGFEMHFATVIFKDGCFMWNIFKFGTNSSFHRSDKNEPLKRTCATWGLEVIGNVHQSPELL